METLFTLLVLVSFIFLVIGIFRPKTSLFWDKNNPTRKKSALVYGGLTILFFVLFGITTDKKTTRKNTISNSEVQNTENKIADEKKEISIDKIDSKKENRVDGEYNEMTLFTVDSVISLEDLSKYCSEHKSEYSNGYFQILVFFKNKNAVRFPDNPITAEFMEEKDLKNIKAIYTINNMNGYSKLDYYDNNAYESKVKSVDIK
jgi:hypothetical protein